MKKTAKLILAVFLASSFITSGFAGESVTLKVSCTIPAIPGLNAPPFPENNKVVQKVETEASEQKEANNYENNGNQTIVQEEKVKDDAAGYAKFASKVRTIYSR